MKPHYYSCQLGLEKRELLYKLLWKQFRMEVQRMILFYGLHILRSYATRPLKHFKECGHHMEKANKSISFMGRQKVKINPTQATAIFASFGSYEKLVSDEQFSNLLNKCICVVVDEAHRAPSRVFGKHKSFKR